MRLNELKCKNCGNKIKVEENQDTITCEYCKSTYSVEDAYTDGYKYEKGRQKAKKEEIQQGMEIMDDFIKNNPVSKFGKIFIIIFFSIFAIAFIFIAINIFSDFKNGGFSSINANSFNSASANSFNSTLEHLYYGTEHGLSVNRAIDEVRKINGKNDEHKIEIKYNESIINTDSEMLSLKSKFEDWTDYDISYEYDNKGYITTMIISDLK